MINTFLVGGLGWSLVNWTIIFFKFIKYMTQIYIPEIMRYMDVCVLFFTDVYQSEIIIYIWVRLLTSSSEKNMTSIRPGSII